MSTAENVTANDEKLETATARNATAQDATAENVPTENATTQNATTQDATAQDATANHAAGDADSAPTSVQRGERKTREGYVVSDKMEKTIVVQLEDRVKHPRYAKVIRRTTKVKAHDDQGTAGIGDRVLLAETRPLSATKRWRLVEILERAK
jgi:small subunit ribosomal protein S17